MFPSATFIGLVDICGMLVVLIFTYDGVFSLTLLVVCKLIHHKHVYRTLRVWVCVWKLSDQIQTMVKPHSWLDWYSSHQEWWQVMATHLEVDQTDKFNFSYTWEHWWYICQNTSGLVRMVKESGNEGQKLGSTWKWRTQHSDYAKSLLSSQRRYIYSFEMLPTYWKVIGTAYHSIILQYVISLYSN